MASFKGVIAKVVSIAEKVKADIVKAAADVDGVLITVSADAPEVEALVNAAVPGAGNFVQVGVEGLELLAGVLDSGGAAAEKNLSDAGLDAAFIAKVKALIPGLKAL